MAEDELTQIDGAARTTVDQHHGAFAPTVPTYSVIIKTGDDLRQVAQWLFRAGCSPRCGALPQRKERSFFTLARSCLHLCARRV